MLFLWLFFSWIVFLPMTDKIFQVVFNGSVTGEYDLLTTKARFKKAFKLKSTQIEKLFGGGDVVIKKNVDEEMAMQFAMKIADVGCECYIEHMPSKDGSVVDEHRSADERRTRFRRPPRPGAIIPDRRLNIRRGEDLAYVDELLLKDGALPIGFQAYPRKK